MSLAGKTLFITGASRGIGKAIGLSAASEGANVVVVGKTDRPHPKLPGTVHSAAEEIRAAGGQALACVCDVRSEDQVERAVEATIDRFGRIDALINNASAIHLAGTLDTEMKRFDLMHRVNVRATFLCAQKCLPPLLSVDNPHILNISPPLNMVPKWFGPHVAYTMSKYGMSMCVLGMAEEFRGRGVAVNALWPRTAIATAAVENFFGGEEAVKRCRRPEIVADAAVAVLKRPAADCSGNFFVDDQVLRDYEGVEDFARYAVDPALAEDMLLPDFFI